MAVAHFVLSVGPAGGASVEYVTSFGVEWRAPRLNAHMRSI